MTHLGRDESVLTVGSNRERCLLKLSIADSADEPTIRCSLSR